MDDFMKTVEAARVLGISQKALWRRVKRGEIPHKRWGHKILISRKELSQFIENLPGISVSEILSRRNIYENPG